MSIHRVLVIGSTGQLGKLIVEQLSKNPQVSLRVTSRHQDRLPELRKRYGDAVFLNSGQAFAAVIGPLVEVPVLIT